MFNSKIKIYIFQKNFARSQSSIQMAKQNLTSFGQRGKLSHYLKLNTTLNILVLLFTTKFVVVKIIAYVKPSET